MPQTNDFVETVQEMLIWAGAFPELVIRTRAAIRMLRVSEEDRASLAAAIRQIADIFKKVNEMLDGDRDPELRVIVDRLRTEVVRATLILDRLRVPDFE